MHRKAFSIFLILSLGSNLLAQTKATPKEYSVYGRVLKDIYKQNRETYSNKSEFVIINETKVDPELKMPSNAKYEGLVKEFNVQNASPAVLERNFPRGAYSYYLVPQAEVDELNEKGRLDYEKRFAIDKLNPRILNPGGVSYTVFYQKYPESSGYYSLSRVGFNGLYAIVLVTGDLGWNGFSRYYILKRVKGDWKVKTYGGIEWR